jgi:hypothetical protein
LVADGVVIVKLTDGLDVPKEPTDEIVAVYVVFGVSPPIVIGLAVLYPYSPVVVEAI